VVRVRCYEWGGVVIREVGAVVVADRILCLPIGHPREPTGFVVQWMHFNPLHILDEKKLHL
jgi:hypothetical protein